MPSRDQLLVSHLAAHRHRHGAGRPELRRGPTPPPAGRHNPPARQRPPRNPVWVGGLPEAVAFSPPGDYVYVGNYHDRTLQVLPIAGGRLVDTGVKLDLPGQPASMRALAR